MKFNIDDYKNKKVVMHCKTKEEAKDFCNVLDELGLNLDELGLKWSNGLRYSETMGFSPWECQNGIYYIFNEGIHSSLKHCKDEGYKILEWEDFMNKEFTKDALKNGDVCVLRNKLVCIAIPEINCLKARDSYLNLNDIMNDLSCCDGFNKYDIMDVYRPQEPYQCDFDKELYQDGKHVFHRAEPIKLTFKEIAEKFGVDEVEIVGE